MARDDLAFLLCPFPPDADARRYLRQALHRVARYLSANELEVRGDTAGWAAASDARSLHEALDSGDVERLIAAPPAPLLERYDLPAAPAFDAWLDLERERLSRRWREAAELAAALGHGSREAAVRAFERVDDPADLAWALAGHARVKLALDDLVGPLALRPQVVVYSPPRAACGAPPFTGHRS